MEKIVSFLGDAECPKCHSALSLVKSETNILKLDKNGKILEVDDCDYQIFLQCGDCQVYLPCIGHGDHFKIYTSLQTKLDIFNIIERPFNIKSPFVRGDD